MEAKKNPQADLRRFAGLFFEIGLVVAFCAVLGAFSYTVQVRNFADFGSLSDVIDEMELIPVTTHRPEVVPQPAVPKVAEVIHIIEEFGEVALEGSFSSFAAHYLHLCSLKCCTGERSQ